MADVNWRVLANCIGVDPAIFYGEDSDERADGVRVNPRPAVAKDLCSRCDVTAECLEWALAHREPWGIWGGLTRKERASITGLGLIA